VAGASSATGTASVVLSTLGAPAGNTIAVYLEYTIAGGTTNRLLLFNPNNSDISVPTTFSTNFALPDTAQRITRLSVDKTTNGSFYAQEFSLDVTVATPPDLPEPFYGFISDGEVMITGHIGTTGGAVVIPGTIYGYPVTSIGHAAFGGWDNLTSMTVPSSVTSIGWSAFDGCNNLTGVYFKGNAPTILSNMWDSSRAFELFDTNSQAIVYRFSGATGWPTVPDAFGGRPTALWNSPIVINGDFETGTLTDWENGAITNAGSRNGAYAAVINSWGPPGFLVQDISARLISGVDYRFTAYINIQSNMDTMGMPMYVPHLSVAASAWSTNYYVAASNSTGLGWQKLELVRSFTTEELATNVYLTVGGMGRFLVDDVTALWGTNPVYLLTVNGGAGGGSYTNKQRITITASNAPVGKAFDRWTGSTLYVASVTSSPTIVTMPATNIALTATFKTAYYALTVRGGTGSGSYTNGQKVTIAATVPVGMKFACWNDANTNASRSITMPPEPVTYTASFTDIQKPTVAITLPTASLKVSNSVYTVKGTATDNGVMTGVFCRVNSGEWTLATTTNLTTNVWKSWSVPLTLTAGSNLLQAYSMDAAGNISATSSVSCTYVVPGVLTIQTNGVGTVTRAPATAVEIGQTYTLTATPGAGFGFVNWAGQVTGTNKVVTFKMTSNTTVVANFCDNVKPAVTISSPTAAQRILGVTGLFTVKGAATDNGVLSTVLVQVGSGSWIPAGTTNSLKNWNAAVTLNTGTNIVRAYSIDTTGNCSATTSVSCVYVPTGILSIQTNGVGTITRAPTGEPEVGKTYTLTAAAGVGSVFSTWTGDASGTNKVFSFTMTTNKTLIANFTDTQKPVVAITAPTAAQRIVGITGLFTVKGTAADNGTLSNVLVQVGGGSWTSAGTTNRLKNWSATVTLSTGTNIIRACSVDTTGNCSATSSVSCVYAATGILTIQTNGVGTVTRAPTGVPEVGKVYTLTAAPGAGFGFRDWTGDVTPSTNKVLTFTMITNMTVTANFRDAQIPVVAITAPTALLRVSNEIYTVKGTASDNGVMTGVYCRVNSGTWTNAATTNGWKNWSVPVTLIAGSNFIQACSADSGGNVSIFANVSCTYIVTTAMAVQKTGNGTVAPDYNGQTLEIGKSYTMTATPSAGSVFVDWTYGVDGDVATNKSAITFAMQSNLVLTANFSSLQDLSEEGLSALSAFIDTNSTLNGDTQLIADAAEAFDLAARSNPNNYTNRIYNALSIMLNLINDPSIRNQATAYGVNLDDFFNPTCIFPTNAPAVDTSVDKFAASVLPAVDKAWAELNAIPATWTGRIEISTNRFPSFDESVWVDAGDVAAMKAALKGLRAFTGLLKAYCLNVNYARLNDPMATQQKIITVDGAVADWTNVPRSLLIADWPDGTGPGTSTVTLTQEVAVVLDGGGSNVALLVTGCPLTISDACGISFDLRLSNGGAFSETRDHRIELWTSTNALGSPVIAGLVYIGTNSQSIFGLETELLDGVLEIKFPVQDGLATSQVTIKQVGCWVHFVGTGWDKWWNTVWSDPQSIGETPIPVLRASHLEFFSKIRNATSLAGAKTDLQAALNGYIAADTLIGKRSTNNVVLHLVDFDPADPLAAEDRVEKRDVVSKILASLAGPVQLEGDSDIEGTLTRPVFLGAFFNGKITTNMLPLGLKGTLNNPDWTVFPDPTLGGILPGMTATNLNKYMRGYTWADVETTRDFSVGADAPYELEFCVATERDNMAITNVTVSGLGVPLRTLESWRDDEWGCDVPSSALAVGTPYTFTVYFADGSHEIIIDKINAWVTIDPKPVLTGTVLRWSSGASVPNADHYAVYTSYGYWDELPLTQTSIDLSEFGYVAGEPCQVTVEIVNKNGDRASRSMEYTGDGELPF